MKLRNPWLIRVAACLMGVILRLWLGTLRVRARSSDGRQHPPDPAVERFIYAFWHESLLAPAKIRTGVQIMISQSADGELIAQVCRRLGIGVVRGSSSRDGAQGLLDMLRVGGGLHLALTPDGPRGPRRRVQPGVVLLASCTGLPIVPVGVGFTRAWRARSWDRFAVPWPFSTVVGVLGEPIRVAQQVDRSGLERARAQVETLLCEATQAAESWARQLAARKGEDKLASGSAATGRAAEGSRRTGELRSDITIRS
jgi:lysophospholipid acyltransferase (LPLAT)-like uncharacterized protein